MSSMKYEILTLISHPRHVERVETFVGGLVEKYQINSDLRGNILISLTEAVNNAIIHGNGQDETKIVHVKCIHQPGCISFKVSDQGHGFDPARVPDPTRPENILKLGGRGVFLMKELSDKILFHDNGRTVEIHFNL